MFCGDRPISINVGCVCQYVGVGRPSPNDGRVKKLCYGIRPIHMMPLKALCCGIRPIYIMYVFGYKMANCRSK